MNKQLLTTDDFFVGEYNFFDRHGSIPAVNFNTPISYPTEDPGDGKKSRIKWTEEEDNILLSNFEPTLENWGEISSMLPRKSMD